MKKDKSLDVTKELKDFGVTEAVQKGSKIELTIDPRNLSKDKKIKLGSGLTKASASAMYNDPYAATFYEGPLSVNSTFSPHEKMRLAVRYFNQDPMVGKIIEMMAVFSNDGFKFECSNPKEKKFWDDWAKTVDLEQVFNWIYLEYYRTGNVAIKRQLVPYKKSQFKFAAPAYSAGGSLDQSDAAKKHMFTKQMIPGMYTVLNPLTVYVDKNSVYGDNLYLNLSETVVDPTSSADLNTLRIHNMPTDLMANSRGDSNKVPLNKKDVRRILRMRQPYEPYGSIIMERAFGAIHEKNKMRQMDMSMVNSVINQIVKVTIGNDDFPATPRQLKNLADAFRNVGKSQVIFWNHTLNIEVIRPDTKVLNAEKYDRVDADIRNAFGISEVLTGTGGSKTNFATAFLSLKAFLTNLQQGRKDVLRWLRPELEDIAEVMGFDSIPEATFNSMSLTDEVAEKQLIIQMIDRGLISYESAQSKLGYDPQIELERKTKEKPLIDEGILGITAIPGQQPGGADAPVNTKKAVVKNNKKQDKQTVDNEDKKTVQLNRRNEQNGKDPSVKLPDKGAPGKAVKGANGRPATPKGKGMPLRTKQPKIKGQASFQQDIIDDKDYAKEIVLAVAEDLTEK